MIWYILLFSLHPTAPATYKLQKVPLLKSIFWPLGPLGGQKKLYHVKFKSKISYLGKKISILPWQMAEQLAVEVDVKNVTERGKNCKKWLC